MTKQHQMFENRRDELREVFKDYLNNPTDRLSQGSRLISMHNSILITMSQILDVLWERHTDSSNSEVEVKEAPTDEFIPIPEFLDRYPICDKTYLQSLVNHDLGMSTFCAKTYGKYKTVHPIRTLMYIAQGEHFSKISKRAQTYLKEILTSEEYDKHFNGCSS